MKNTPLSHILGDVCIWCRNTVFMARPTLINTDLGTTNEERLALQSLICCKLLVGPR